jgi:hypothetical protein
MGWQGRQRRPGGRSPAASRRFIASMTLVDDRHQRADVSTRKFPLPGMVFG